MQEVKCYCVKCKKIMPMVNPTRLVKKTKGGKKMVFLRGKCKACGTGMAKMLPIKK